MDAFNADDATSGWADLNGDGIIDTRFIDHTGDGITDGRLTDLNGDGLADTIGYDSDNDGREDVQVVDTDYDGVLDTQLFDTDHDGVSDRQTPAGPFSTGEGSTGVPPVDAATQSFMNLVQSVVQDGATLTQAAIHPGSVPPEEVAAAKQRGENLDAGTRFLEGLNYEAEVRNDIIRSDYERQWNETAREEAAAAEREAERAQSEADWAVWRSKNGLT